MPAKSGAAWQGLNDTVVSKLASKLENHKLWGQTSRLLAEAMPELVSATLLMSSGSGRRLQYVAGEMLSAGQLNDIVQSLRSNGEARWLHKGDQRRHYHYGIAPFQLAAGGVLCCLVITCEQGGQGGAPLPPVVGKTVSRLRLLLENYRLESTVGRLHRALDEGPAAIILLDAQRRIEYVNPVFTEVTGFRPGHVLGRPVEVLNSQQLGNASFSPAVWQSVADHKSWQMETLQRRKDGEHYWAETRISAIHDDDGNICQYFVLQNDFTEARLFSAKLSYDSAHDAVTGLINRHQFELHLEEVLASARSYDEQHALLYLDLDEFKVINDTCGHAAGDELLRQVALLLREVIDAESTFSRLGGDEFAVLIENSNFDAAEVVANQLREAVHQLKFRWRGDVYATGTSIGLTIIDGRSSDAQEIMRQADISCNVAKESGRNRLHVFNAEDDALMLREGEMKWSSRISECLTEGRFELYGQPIVPVKQQAGPNQVHVEILVRMVGREGEHLLPGTFMAAAERYNLVSDIDRWVVENAVDWLMSHHGKDDMIKRLSINLSGHSLTDPGFLEFMLKILSRPALPTEKLCFEITETVAVENFSSALDFIGAVKDKGCLFALDDFGTGMSSFAYLKNLPVDYLKIDGHFIRQIDVDPIDYAMLKSINEIGHLMGMETVAEYVETRAIVDRLWAIGVDYAQGHFVGEAMLLDDLMASALAHGET